jgi:hypothetical protein
VQAVFESRKVGDVVGLHAKMSAPLQGISLVLWSYQTWRHHPEGSTLAALSAAVRQRVMSFKPSELATSMDAFSALGFHPGNDVVQVPIFLHSAFETAIGYQVLSMMCARHHIWAEQ